ncbi:MAG: Fe-S cluster assembly protein SufD [Sodalis sp. (in: enterobacteria)]
MAGLLNKLNNNKAHVLTQWRQLFTNQHVGGSAESEAHWQNVERLGVPTRQHEHWKYTSLDKLLANKFVSAIAGRLVSSADRDALSLKLDACRLVFVDNRFVPSLSDNDTDLWKINVERGADRRELPTPIQSEVFLHLTESLSQESTRIYLPEGKAALRTLYLLHISYGSEDKKTLSTLHYRHHLDIGAGAQGQVIEHFISINTHGYFRGARTSIVVGNNAHLSHTKLVFENPASYHFGHNDIRLGSNAVVQSSTFIIGKSLTRHQTSVQLNGEKADLAINSLLLPSGEAISDTRTYLEHNKGYCLSRQLHKVIASDRGKGIFSGLIKVAKNAIKTDSQMRNHNLLLGHLAEIDSKPQLEIYADEVKCNHGATIAQIDKEQMFFLRSRGIPSKDAEMMIIYAFAAEVAKTIYHDSTRETVLIYLANVLKWSTA